MGGGSPGSASEGLDPGKLAARAGSARPPASPGPAGRGYRGGQGREKARKRGASPRPQAGSAGSARGAGWAAAARGGCPGRRPQPRRARGPRLPPPAPRWRRGPRGSPAREAWGGGEVGGGEGEDGTEGERRQKKKKRRPAPGIAAAPAYFFFSFSPPAPSMANRCPAVPSRPAGPGLRSGLSAGSVGTRRERGKSRGGVRRRDAPSNPPQRGGGSCRLCSPGAPARAPRALGPRARLSGPGQTLPATAARTVLASPQTRRLLCTETLRQRQGAGKGGGALGARGAARGRGRGRGGERGEGARPRRARRAPAGPPHLSERRVPRGPMASDAGGQAPPQPTLLSANQEAVS